MTNHDMIIEVSKISDEIVNKDCSLTDRDRMLNAYIAAEVLINRLVDEEMREYIASQDAIGNPDFGRCSVTTDPRNHVTYDTGKWMGA